MRIIGGTYRNRRLDPPMAMEARPTTDFAKEGLFNVLHHNHALEGIRVLDLFAGTGNISLEFLSRGARSVTSVERERKLTAFMERTAKAWNVEGWRVVRADVFSFLKTHRGTYDIVFADPPFALEGLEEVPTLVLNAGLLAPEGLLIVEHSDRTDLSQLSGYRGTRRYGLVRFSFFGQPVAAPPTPAP